MGQTHPKKRNIEDKNIRIYLFKKGKLNLRFC